MQNLTPTLLLISLVSLAFSVAALAESDLAREVRSAQGKAQQREKQSQAQDAADVNQARKRAVTAALARAGLKAVLVEVVGESADMAGVQMAAKLSDGRVCEATAEESEFASRAGDKDDSYTDVSQGIEQGQRELRIMKKLADAAQTRRAEKRNSSLAEMEDADASGRGLQGILVRHVNNYAVEAGVVKIQIYGNCFDSAGRAKEFGAFTLANKNGAVIEL